MNLRKGTSIINTKAFVIDRFELDAWHKLLGTMSEADRRALSSVAAEAWYDMALHTRLNRSLCDFFYDGNLAAAEELGRFSAERDLAGNRRWILSLVRPSFILRHMDAYWRQDEGSGSWTCEVRDQELAAQLSGWQGGDVVLCRRLVGYIGRMLEIVGVVTWREHLHAEAGDPTKCTFRFGWRLDHDVPSGDLVSSKAELREVARDLELFSDVVDLADAITELIHVQLSYPYVALRVRPADSDGLTRVSDVGQKGSGTPICSLIHRAGRIVGQLDAEAGPDSRQDLFDELAPLLALPLDATRLSGLQDDVESCVARRLLKAKKEWQLTAKETEVLGLLIRGMKNKEIALELGCKEGTIEQHVIRILRKAGCESRNELSWKFWTKL